MDNIRNLFKHNIFFTTSLQYHLHMESGAIHTTGLYETDVIHNPERYGIMDYHDIKRKIKPFLYYLTSSYKCLSREYNNIYANNADIKVGVFLRNSYKYAILDKFWVYNFEREQDLNLYTFDEFVRRDEPVLNEPFKIHVYVKWEYISNETNEPNESESEDEEDEEEEIKNESEEDTTPVAISESLHSDQCVVCLSKKPELLFVNCLHRCVCLKCKKTSPFRRCPSCRTLISIKVKI